MREYFLNFFVWYYLIKFGEYLRFVRFVFVFLMMKTNALPMIKYIKYPMFGDYSRLGKIIGPILRFFWALIGSIISLIVIIPFLFLVPIVFLLPILPVIQIALTVL